MPDQSSWNSAEQKSPQATSGLTVTPSRCTRLHNTRDGVNHPAKKEQSDDTTKKGHQVSSRYRHCRRPIEAADLLSPAQRNQALRPIAAPHSRSQSANAHHALAGMRTDGDPSSAGLCADAPKGRKFADRTGMEFRADASPVQCVGRANGPRVLRTGGFGRSTRENGQINQVKESTLRCSRACESASFLDFSICHII